MRFFAVTDVGKKRTLNEDNYIADGTIFAVADGMGGHRAGEVASAMALDALHFGLTKRSKESVGERLVESIKRANKKVHETAVRDTDHRGMGTTLTVAVAHDDATLYVGHVGDSRLYLLRDGLLKQLTTDHSLVAQMVASGHLKPEEAEVHPQRSVITRAIGSEVDVKIDTFTQEVLPNDRYLLCTDGLSGMLTDDVIAEVLRDHSDIQDAARELVSWANDRGGNDNITVIMFEPGENQTSFLSRLLRPGR
ncbi:MAG TPA: Stp1/IreP family PP2C-type Ser/Thr phosphatase [Candidatus Aquicultor sp.]|jgi:protein phosphatase